MQILRSGMSVHARRRRWRIVDARAYNDCQLITLSGLGPTNSGVETRLLVPFDSIEPIPASPQLRFVRARRWRRACRELLSSQFSEGRLCAAGRARIELFPHQLEPAIALARGDGCRVLLADEVGLGKTIQAGLAIAELRARGAADRVLIVTPAGLREQWAGELSERFSLQADVVDFRAVARRVSALPYGVNPWTTWPIAIVSVDYVKRADVLPAVAACAWDAVVVDEAHGLAGDSDRHEAVSALAARAPYVLLLTATPHNGDARAFRALCAIGGEHDRLLVFRRTRDVVQPAAPRRVHRLLLRPSAGELEMHARLEAFGRAVREERGELDPDVWLALAVLRKRAFSSARALQQTIARRLASLEPEQALAEQLELPLDDMGESDGADDAPAWQPAMTLRDRALERRLLTSLVVAAEAAAARETKLTALSRLLSRIAEPVIVFTEYRDTLALVAHITRSLGKPSAILHGGLSRQERSAALRAFAAGECAILLATDAAGEGLNLQGACRIVVNLELPWNPMRLEQRIGRVDRIGQQRTVHAFHLVAAGTGEERLLAGLRDRIARARTDVGAPNPLGDPDAGMGDAESDNHATAAYKIEGILEVRRLEARRALSVRRSESQGLEPAGGGPHVSRARHSRTRARLGARILLIFEIGVEDGCRRCVLSETLAVSVALTRRPPGRIGRHGVDELVAAVAPEAAALVHVEGARAASGAVLAVSAFIAARAARERQIAITLAPAEFQPGLFDRRVHHAHAAASAARQELADVSARKLAGLERQAALSVLHPALRLVLIP
jgi:superfamily II DNA or RNA helicase